MAYATRLLIGVLTAAIPTLLAGARWQTPRALISGTSCARLPRFVARRVTRLKSRLEGTDPNRSVSHDAQHRSFSNHACR
jgi:hypothetical protein